MKNTFSHFTKIKLDSGTPGSVLFPGVDRLPAKSFGYLRSQRLENHCQRITNRQRPAGKKLPYKDYPNDVVVDAQDYLSKRTNSVHHLVISARNIMNETGYALRFNNEWYFRQTGMVPPQHWPVLALGEDGIQIDLLEKSDQQKNIVSGVPLIISGQPVTRNFLLKHCSDVAHTFEVHPRGWIGPSSKAWQDLSELWQELWDKKTHEDEFGQKMEDLALQHKAAPSRNLLHSIAAKDQQGSTWFFAITGSLNRIAEELVQTNQIEHAFLLDNGGSVGYSLFTPVKSGKSDSLVKQVIVCGPNYRMQGTVFMEFVLDDFLHPGSYWPLD